MPTFPGTFGGEEAGGRVFGQLQQLLPPGPVWKLEPGSTIQGVLLALSDELERVHVRASNLIEESDPRTASETIGNWESALGLPDEQVPEIPATLEERRVAVTQKFVARGGQHYGYFEDLCAACGWPLISIGKGPELLLRAGFRVNDRAYGAAFAYSMQLTLDTPEPFALDSADFERVIRHATHSHIVCIFVYT